MKLLKKIFASRIAKISLVLSLLLAFSAQSVAAYQPVNEGFVGRAIGFRQALKAPEMNLESFVYETINAIIFSIIKLTIGISDGLGGVTQVPGQQNLAQAKEPSLLSSLLGVTQFMFETPAASSIQYLTHLGDKIGLVSPAYAQGGMGWTSLRPVIKIWSGFRNVAYGLFALALIVAGFMVMFRVKTSPQTIITIQTAIPKVILALLMVTFSYAIAGFILDLTYVLVFAVYSVLKNQDLIGAGWFGSNDLTTKKMLVRWNSFWFGMAIIFSSFGSIDKLMDRLVLGFLGVPAGVPGPIALVFEKAVSPISGLFVTILSIILIVALIKINWILIKSYVTIIMAVIIAPFQILLGAFPGMPGPGSWLKTIITNAIPFPIVAILFLITSVLIGGQGSMFQEGVTPPPLLGTALAAPGTIEGILGLGIIFLMPNLVAQLQALIQKPLGLEPSITAAGVLGAMGMGKGGLFPRAITGGVVQVAGERLDQSLGTSTTAGRDAKAIGRRLLQGLGYRQASETPEPGTGDAQSVGS
ncbi:hypothetical protein ACFLZP_00215 [Patescibacteria group bacterium]